MGGNESVQVTAGIWGFLVLFGLAIACWFLFRSMNTHLRRLTFAEREEQARTQGVSSGEDPGREGQSPRVEDDPIGSARH